MRFNLNEKYSGTFEVGDQELLGELTFAKKDSLLKVVGNIPFPRYNPVNVDIHGQLIDGHKVSLLHCVCTQNGTMLVDGVRKYYAHYFPHFVISRSDKVCSEKKIVKSIVFKVDDAVRAFNDFGVFGEIFNPSEPLRTKIEEESPYQGIKLNEKSAVYYYSGKREIFSSYTSSCRIEGYYAPNFTVGGVGGFSIDSDIKFKISYESAVNFEKSIDDVLHLVKFIEVICNRTQNIDDLIIEVSLDNEQSEFCIVHWSMKQERKSENELDVFHSVDVLISPLEEKKQFEQILLGWFLTKEKMAFSRNQFFSSFSMRGRIDINRLVVSVNMFDTLPSELFQIGSELPDDFVRICDEFRDRLKDQPNIPERDSILSTIGQIKKPRLKRKIRMRCQIVQDAVSSKFDDLSVVTDEAVNCRNFFVHGGKSKINYEGNPNLIAFFIEIMEFFYIASQFVEFGWDVNKWIKADTVGSHRFCNLKIDYNDKIKKFHALISP